MILATSNILAAFITPWLATAGAAAVAAPILIHLLARRRFRRIRWAAMDFLIDAERRNRRRIRMEEWILLALRCLAVLLIGLLVARPFLTPSGLTSVLSGAQRTERVLVLDDTFSMGYEADDGSPFTRTKTAIRRLLTQIHEESPDDTVTILRASNPVEPLVAGAFLDSKQLDELLTRIESQNLSQRSMDLPAVFQGIVDALERDSSILNAAVYLLSDFQRKDWLSGANPSPPADGGAGGGSGSEDSAAQNLAQSLEDWAGEDRELRLFFINLGEDGAANLAVTELTAQGVQIVAGTEGIIRAGIANLSPASLGALPLQLTVGSLPAAAKDLPGLDERQTTSVDLEATFLRAGDEPVRLDLPRDKLPLDDSRYLNVPVVSAVRVLLINGEPSGDSFDDEVALLATALRPEGEVFSGYEVAVVDEPGLEDVNLSDFAAIVLANVYRVSDPVIESLERYARAGGGVLIFLGDQIDPDLYNSTLYKSGAGLSPAQLVELVRPSEPAHLQIVSRIHPALGALAQSADLLGLGDVPFFSFFSAQPHVAEGTALDGSARGGNVSPLPSGRRSAAAEEGSGVRATGTAATPDRGDGANVRGTEPRLPLSLPGRGAGVRVETQDPQNVAAEILAQFGSPDRPAIIERSFGDGLVLLITTTADKEWHLWPNHPTFLPVMLELVSYVARGNAGRHQHLVGTPIDVSFDAAAFQPDVSVRSPLYPNEPEVFVTATPSADAHGLLARWEQTETSGFYQFVLKRLDGGEEIRYAAVNVDSRESDLAMIDEAQLRRTMGSLPLEYIHGLENLASGTSEGRTELWPFCLALAVLVLMTEQALAWRWGRAQDWKLETRN